MLSVFFFFPFQNDIRHKFLFCSWISISWNLNLPHLPPQSAHQEGAQHKFPRGRSKARCFHRRLMKILNGRHASKEVFESLAVSNAVELFKLVFLSTSTTREVPNLLAENLRRYSEHDLFSAFSHLREKKIMVSFVLKIIIVINFLLFILIF